MFRRTMRYAILAVLALALAAALTFTFSPAARAAVQSIFSFNGVDVAVDDSTGKLVTSGNTGAIIQQDDHSVVIQGQNGEIAGMAVAPKAQAVDASQILSQYPELVLPAVPAGYTLEAQGQLFEDGSLILTWKDVAGNTITYQRTRPILVSVGSGPDGQVPPGSEPGQVITDTTQIVSGNAGGVLPEAGLAVSGGDTVITSTLTENGPQTAVSFGQTTPGAVYTWEADGYAYMLAASDASLTQADLQAMLP